jgi:hypothetical protein
VVLILFLSQTAQAHLTLTGILLVVSVAWVQVGSKLIQLQAKAAMLMVQQ